MDRQYPQFHKPQKKQTHRTLMSALPYTEIDEISLSLIQALTVY